MAENIFAIKRGWTPFADASWRNIESSFEVQQQKTPPGKVVEPSVPAAPRKLQQASAQIRREGLKPRRLIHDLSSPDSGIDADKENQPPAEAAAAAAAAPIQESENTIPNSQVKIIRPGSLRDRISRWIEIHFSSQQSTISQTNYQIMKK
ncbi:uncharacterized protein LOC131667057 isoform X2 [Phymastichus coffea]|uniref:uncharacterized protein LOC131667057 isoform X2 n=1 Tax=Phymastichus coffea TaxID=108790 RepID=UPI00273C9E43|nr:uncharacterized protein LOC131667057 isoform X2 [Phymastichus coffea]